MSSKAEELLEGAKLGRWILPSADLPNPVALARAIASICGVQPGSPAEANDPVVEQFRALIGEPEHLVFVIADGFGMNFVKTLDENSFSRTQLALVSRAAFPSSTGPNLFTYGRGQWPGQHGNLGWYVHLSELGERATLFPWIRTRDGVSLTQLGLSGDGVFPGDLEISRYRRKSRVFIPDSISRSVATWALYGVGSVVGYDGLAQAVDRVSDRITNAPGPTYSHIFWPAVDGAAHEFGTSHPNTHREVERLDAEIGRLRRQLPKNARIVLTADHGHLDFDEGHKFLVERTDALREMLADEPAGDERSLVFHVRRGFEQDFAAEFEHRFSEHYFLLSTGDVLELELLGPGGVSEVTLPRLGSFMAIAKSDAGMKFLSHDNRRPITLVSQHGGMSPDEMLVPVIIA